MSLQNQVHLWVESAGGSGAKIFDHTSICVVFTDGLKFVFSYNENGVSSVPIDKVLPQINKTIHIGETTKTLVEIIQQTQKMGKTSFKDYNPVHSNCNHFSDALSKWLCEESTSTVWFHQSKKCAIAASIVVVMIGVAIKGLYGAIVGGGICAFTFTLYILYGLWYDMILRWNAHKIKLK